MSTSNSVISIITPSFNRASIVHETAESIFGQTSANWEWVIVDDGSTDNSWELLEQYAAKDERVKIYKREREPKGACTCRNIAVERSTGDYVMFLDTDDVLAPFCIEQRLAAIEKEGDVDFVVFPMLLFNKELHDLDLLWNIDKNEDDLQRVLIGDPVCQGTGPLWKKESFKEVGMWREDLKLWQDIELHIRSFLYPVKYKKRLDLHPDVYLRISEDSLSRVGYHAAPKLKSRKVVFEYTCTEMAKKQKLDKYTDAVRSMGVDVILSLINGRLYDDADELLEITKHHDIFKREELKYFSQYMNAYKAKLYKLPALFNPIKKRVQDIPMHYETTMNKIKWEQSNYSKV
ncbi:MAG: glycosyltransferase family 2 protein [Chitinophagales bacterium]|nr:glycosyltransferase family 2 protein [Chitinophagaceae bacterium]MCB9064629.1 glycosyltransferase family 2 protein [Chitinophagales bacterium]